MSYKVTIEKVSAGLRALELAVEKNGVKAQGEFANALKAAKDIRPVLESAMQKLEAGREAWHIAVQAPWRIRRALVPEGKPFEEKETPPAWVILNSFGALERALPKFDELIVEDAEFQATLETARTAEAEIKAILSDLQAWHETVQAAWGEFKKLQDQPRQPGREERPVTLPARPRQDLEQRASRIQVQSQAQARTSRARELQEQLDKVVGGEALGWMLYHKGLKVAYDRASGRIQSLKTKAAVSGEVPDQIDREALSAIRAVRSQVDSLRMTGGPSAALIFFGEAEATLGGRLLNEVGGFEALLARTEEALGQVLDKRRVSNRGAFVEKMKVAAKLQAKGVRAQAVVRAYERGYLRNDLGHLGFNAEEIALIEWRLMPTDAKKEVWTQRAQDQIQASATDHAQQQTADEPQVELAQETAEAEAEEENGNGFPRRSEWNNFKIAVVSANGSGPQLTFVGLEDESGIVTIAEAAAKTKAQLGALLGYKGEQRRTLVAQFQLLTGVRLEKNAKSQQKKDGKSEAESRESRPRGSRKNGRAKPSYDED